MALKNLLTINNNLTQILNLFCLIRSHHIFLANLRFTHRKNLPSRSIDHHHHHHRTVQPTLTQ